METVASTTANLFRICKALQNPDMYSPEWADACTFRNFKNENGGELVASRGVKKGEVLSLYPLHAIGLMEIRNRTKLSCYLTWIWMGSTLVVIRRQI
jgi:hypothetical protein